MQVSIIGFEDLPEGIVANIPNNGCGKENANYIRIDFGNGITSYRSDAMEPEDASFHRDLSWIKSELEESFNAGRVSAKLDIQEKYDAFITAMV